MERSKIDGKGGMYTPKIDIVKQLSGSGIIYLMPTHKTAGFTESGDIKWGEVLHKYSK